MRKIIFITILLFFLCSNSFSQKVTIYFDTTVILKGANHTHDLIETSLNSELSLYTDCLVQHGVLGCEYKYKNVEVNCSKCDRKFIIKERRVINTK